MSRHTYYGKGLFLDPPVFKERLCILCLKYFKSEGPYNRRCEKCERKVQGMKLGLEECSQGRRVSISDVRSSE